ncbi:MAG: MlaE family lipid ABC transporter permease subunit [Alphaproteobacteria bacterium]|nr:MlaE family lipid ABC transporter permease subunit [Alphaproteobacteria bacterium]
MAPSGRVKVTEEGETARVSLAGAWTIAAAAELDGEIRRLRLPQAKRATLDLSGIEALDTAGAWLIRETAKSFTQAGASVAYAGVDRRAAALLERVGAADQPLQTPEKEPPSFVELLARLGFGSAFVVREARAYLGFLGLTIEAAARTALRPSRFRFTSFVHHLEAVGLNALPIVGLISFLIGIVMAYQGATQLRLFGAEIFVVDLVAISVLREIGILLTAIVVAGRSGSAFTAQIGTMKLREEVDAMRTLGLDPIEVLVLPRIAALLVALPLLCFFSDIMGLLGGQLMAWADLDISPQTFIHRVQERIPIRHFWVGMAKAPVFAAMIGLVGCYQGLRVKGDSGSVGRLTTRSVVESIFLVIVADALFSIFFNLIDV